MKKISLLMFLGLIFSLGLEAQRSSVKLGLGGLVVKAVNVRIETALADRISF